MKTDFLVPARAAAIALFCSISGSPGVQAATYGASAITAIATQADGTMYVRFDGLPNPGSCGANHGWVAINPSANYTIKAEAIALYLSGRPVRIDTDGCISEYESVIIVYSPGG